MMCVGPAQGLMLSGLVSITLVAVENYSTALRCTAMGVFVCCGHIGALIAGPIFTILPMTSTVIAAFITSFIMIIPTTSTLILKDSCSLL